MKSAMFVIGTLIVGLAVASLQHIADNTAQFIGVALAPAISGLVIGGIRRLFGPTNVLKWMFGWSVVALAIQVLSRPGSN